VALAESLGCPVFRHAANLGRGAVRARAMQEARHDLVLCCDATNILAPDFLSRVLPRFDTPGVAAVFGRFVAGEDETVLDRWRSRHLFKAGVDHQLSHHASFITSGAVIRKSIYETTGGYNSKLPHSEDADLGERFLSAGYEVIFDPELNLTSVSKNTLNQVLERYWRWYVGKDEAVSLKDYPKQVIYSVKVMARQDLAAHDPLSVPISLLSPHYQFCKSIWRRLHGTSQGNR